MKTVSNIDEFTIEILSQFSDMFENSFEQYSYVFENDIIKINNPDNITVLSITPSSITIKDVIQDAIDEVEYEYAKEQNAECYKDLINFIQSLEPATIAFLTNRIMYIEKPEPNFKTYLYFNTEEESFQNSTIHSNVLPFESAKHVNKIKSIIIKDLKRKWLQNEEL